MTRSRPPRLPPSSACWPSLLAACTSGATPGASAGASAAASTGGGDKGTVKIAINPWIGAKANVVVVAYLLKNQLGYDVTTTELAEEVAWPGFETRRGRRPARELGPSGPREAVHHDKKVAQDDGANGVTGIIGWYVPGWMVDKYPDITDWNNLNKYADLFKTTESGDKGQFLGSDPTFVTNDEALITNLDLNYKVVYSGSEASTITAYKQAVEKQTPLLGYFYDPQWLHSEVKLVQVKLPAYTAGCDADAKKVACDYPPYTLNKIVATKFNENGAAAATLVKNFSWKNADQNSVAESLNSGMSDDEAAKKWVDANEATWKAWLPAGS